MSSSSHDDSAPRRATPTSTRAVLADATDYPVAADARELGAARRAAAQSWVDVPYYAQRYGARGRQFSHSDSVWLVTLCDLPRPAAIDQVQSLARALATRGMPRWLLERHLETLRVELERAVPGRRERYAVLGDAARELWLARQATVPDQLLTALDASFAARVGSPWRRRYRRMGAVLAAAVADERAGIESAVRSVETWASDPVRFPQRWVQAVRETIAAARAHAP